MNRVFKVLQLLLIFNSLQIFGQSHYPGQHEKLLQLNDTKNVEVEAFDLSDVVLKESRFKENMKRESEWIMSFPVQRLLHSFRTNAGVYSGYEGGHYEIQPLGGWESMDCELRGHAIGHMLSSLGLFYASTGNEDFKKKGDSLIAGLHEVQITLGDTGYLSAYPENLINRNIRGERVWAPWYTLHKLFAGLIDQYLYSGNKEALEVVKGMANWAYNKLKPLSEEQRALMLRNEFGGMNDSFYTLYSITKNPDHKWLAEYFYDDKVLDPLKAKEDNLNKMHANTYIPKLIGLARATELGGNDEYLEVADFFWNTVVEHHSFVTGSNSDKEKFFESDKISEHLTGYTGESCNVYNMLKLTRHLFAQNPTVKYLDYYEKALYNHILGQQDPVTGYTAYFLPMLPGAHKVYSTRDESFWCCVGTGFENHAKYGEFIYSHDDESLYVNLFIPSILNWEEKGISLIQENNFPRENTTQLTIETNEPKKINLKVRYPSWATDATVRINGKKKSSHAKKGSFIQISEEWKDGDKIEISFGMELEAVPTPNDPDILAFTYGPVVLAGRMGTKNMTEPAPYSNPDVRNDYYTYDYKVPTELTNKVDLNINRLSREIERISENKLNFLIKDQGITLSPIANIHGERYIIYWDNK
ncbi:glycoside hydrolase family 127 protein [Autumnicola psychrophila]|uniref:Glycoside hydrolase family 127 protein n=1 Tax=Autumnicola psychrophila TaxID=3075592 RepID=A0ABU3DLZ0_9FLAO|nr:glycoside hydrolase family 127 protein [Zunongwangia sp. F225]MDT0684735.1 glycoside hydrolase family 127 protein [Zunongwangia sp. F225]